MIDGSVAPIQNMWNRPDYSGQYCYRRDGPIAKDGRKEPNPNQHIDLHRTCYSEAWATMVDLRFEGRQNGWPDRRMAKKSC